MLILSSFKWISAFEIKPDISLERIPKSFVASSALNAAHIYRNETQIMPAPFVSSVLPRGKHVGYRIRWEEVRDCRCCTFPHNCTWSDPDGWTAVTLILWCALQFTKCIGKAGNCSCYITCINIVQFKLILKLMDFCHFEGLPFFTIPGTVSNAPEPVFLHQIFYSILNLI